MAGSAGIRSPSAGPATRPDPGCLTRTWERCCARAHQAGGARGRKGWEGRSLSAPLCSTWCVWTRWKLASPPETRPAARSRTPSRRCVVIGSDAGRGPHGNECEQPIAERTDPEAEGPVRTRRFWSAAARPAAPACPPPTRPPPRRSHTRGHLPARARLSILRLTSRAWRQFVTATIPNTTAPPANTAAQAHRLTDVNAPTGRHREDAARVLAASGVRHVIFLHWNPSDA